MDISDPAGEPCASEDSFSEAERGAVADLFAELVNTEAAYVADLKTMVTVYSRPAQKLVLGLLSPEDNAKIFSNVEQLLMCNDALLTALRKPGRPEAVMAQAFLSIAPFFKLYAQYCANYLTALATLQSLRGTGFDEFLSSQMARPACRRQPLSSFLIKPVHHIHMNVTWHDRTSHGITSHGITSHDITSTLGSDLV